MLVEIGIFRRRLTGQAIRAEAFDKFQAKAMILELQPRRLLGNVHFPKPFRASVAGKIHENLIHLVKQLLVKRGFERGVKLVERHGRGVIEHAELHDALRVNQIILREIILRDAVIRLNHARIRAERPPIRMNGVFILAFIRKEVAEREMRLRVGRELRGRLFRQIERVVFLAALIQQRGQPVIDLRLLNAVLQEFLINHNRLVRFSLLFIHNAF